MIDLKNGDIVRQKALAKSHYYQQRMDRLLNFVMISDEEVHMHNAYADRLLRLSALLFALIDRVVSELLSRYMVEADLYDFLMDSRENQLSSPVKDFELN